MTFHASRPSILSNYFCFDKFKTSLMTEVVAGVSTYLSLAYIFIVNPTILASAGIDQSAVLFATVVVSGLATIAMGLFGRLPFAVAPGLEMNGFFAFVVCGTLGMSWQQGLGTVFFSGILCLIFTALRVRRSIIESMPSGLKKAIGTSVGAFVATIGLYLAHIINFKGGSIDLSRMSLSAFGTSSALILYVGAALCLALGWKRLKFPGGMLVAIVVGAVMCALFGVATTKAPTLNEKMLSAAGQLDLTVILSARFWSPILVFFIVDFLGGIGKIIGLTSNTDIQDAKGDVPTLHVLFTSTALRL